MPSRRIEYKAGRMLIVLERDTIAEAVSDGVGSASGRKTLLSRTALCSMHIRLAWCLATRLYGLVWLDGRRGLLDLIWLGAIDETSVSTFSTCWC